MKTKRFIPSTLPLKLSKEKYQKRLAKADLYLQKTQKILHNLPSPKLLYILKLREAFLSLHTQGIDVTLSKMCQIKTQKKKDTIHTKRIKNYLKALSYIEKIQESTPFGKSFWEKLHSFVEKDFGKIKQDVGRIRNRQNWIGPKDCKIEEAFFLPPPREEIEGLLKELRTYIDSDEDPLLQLGIAFAQFLGIHPFMDGNGRIARLLAAALMKKRRKLDSAIFFLSDYFLANRIEYLKNLHHLSLRKDWNRWLCFYCKAVEEESRKLLLRLERLDSLYLRMDRALLETLPKRTRKRVLIFLFEHPIFTLPLAKKKTELPYPLLKKVLQILASSRTIAHKNIFFAVQPLCKICEKK